MFDKAEQLARAAGRSRTLLVDSVQLDRGDALDPAFRKAAHAEIETFKHELAARFPGRSAEDISDEDILREVMNTVGKPGKLGEHIRCVVSVAMLTEGWDARTVTHVLGIRAFGTQLLCEQVVGRALRRASYDADANGMFEPEYAEVYGVPFSFLSVEGGNGPKKPRFVREVRSLPERSALRIEFPRVVGYRFDMPTDHLEAEFDATSILQLTPKEVALEIELDPIVGEIGVHKLDLRNHRMQTVEFAIAKRTLDTSAPRRSVRPLRRWSACRALGGRLIWHLADSADLEVAWLMDRDPRRKESELLAAFETQFGALPLANLQR